MDKTKQLLGFPETLLVTSYENDHGKEADQEWLAYEAHETPEDVMVSNEMQETEVALYRLVSIHRVSGKAEISAPTAVL